jgi:glutamyl-tRNA synthetase
VDDHLMKITHVIRGEEWISSTPKHILEYKAFGWTPPKFAHCPLILSPERTKLSKRHGALPFVEYAERGFLPEAMINFIALLGWSPGEEDRELFSVEELIERFTLEGIVNHPVIFDIQKLEWMNGVYIRQCDLGRLTNLCIPYLQRAGLVSEKPSVEEWEYVRSVVALEQERMKLLSDIVELADFFFVEDLSYDEKGIEKWLSKEYVPNLLRELIQRLQNLQDFTVENVEATVRKTGEDMGLSGGQVIHPVRMAVTGRTVGPGLFETMAVLGKERVLSRLERTIEMLSEVIED